MARRLAPRHKVLSYCGGVSFVLFPVCGLRAPRAGALQARPRAARALRTQCAWAWRPLPRSASAVVPVARRLCCGAYTAARHPKLKENM